MVPIARCHVSSLSTCHVNNRRCERGHLHDVIRLPDEQTTKATRQLLGFAVHWASFASTGACWKVIGRDGTWRPPPMEPKLSSPEVLRRGVERGRCEPSDRGLAEGV